METTPATFAEKCSALKKEYEALTEQFHESPDARILAAIPDSEDGTSIHFNLGSSGMRDADKYHDKAVVPLLEAIHNANCKDLVESVDLSWNRIGDGAAKSMAAFLMHNQHITSVNLTGNDITSNGGIEIAKALRSKNALQSLTLSGNKLGDETMVLLSELFVEDHLTALTHLDVANCDFGHVGWTHLMTRLIENRFLEQLDVSNCRVVTLSHEMCSILAKVLRHNRCLRTLNVSKQGDGIGDDGMQWISEALRGNHVLETLDLSCNRVGCDGVRALSQILSKSKEKNEATETCSLKRLSLRGNRITDIGASFICKIIESNETLEWLDLRSTHLQDSGLYLIAQTMNQLKQSDRGMTLKTLLLDDNSFGKVSSRMWRIVMEERESTVLAFDFWPLIVE